MDNNTKNILLSELYSATGYSERLLHALLNMTDLGRSIDAKAIAKRLYLDLNQFFVNEIYLGPSSDSLLEPPKDLTEIKKALLSSKAAMESQIQLGFEDTYSLAPKVIQFINILYTHCHEFHELLNRGSDLEIQLPRINLVEIHYEEEDSFEEHLSPYQENESSANDSEDDWDDIDANHDEIPFFFLSSERIFNIIENKLGDVTSLEWQRSKKYDSLLHEGHQSIFKKDHKKALTKFKRALNYKETAEILTLIGWAYSIQEKREEAKSYCLKAISLDPDYGPPYNDLGSYLLAEGQTKESLKWFELAKKAINYQNREYPYINSGRALMAMSEYKKALDQFSKALTLAPYHEELHATVERLQASIKKKNNLTHEGLNGVRSPPLS